MKIVPFRLPVCAAESVQTGKRTGIFAKNNFRTGEGRPLFGATPGLALEIP
jgi:hypothetical protein